MSPKGDCTPEEWKSITGAPSLAVLWGLDAASPRRIGVTTGSGDGRADGEDGDPEWRAQRDGVIGGTQAGVRLGYRNSRSMIVILPG